MTAADDVPDTAPLRDDAPETAARRGDAKGDPRDLALALGPGIDLALVHRGADLVAGFTAGAGPDPFARICAARGWSYLGLSAASPARLRDAAAVSLFDALVDGTLIDGFDRVLFVGGGPCADAAMGYSIAAPGSRWLAIGAPAAPAAAGRYAARPDLLGAGAGGWLVFDPRSPREAGTVSRLAGPRIAALPFAPGAPGGCLEALAGSGALGGVVALAVEGALDETSFARLLHRGARAGLRGLAAQLLGGIAGPPRPRRGACLPDLTATFRG